jgi:hypothetical protein
MKQIEVYLEKGKSRTFAVALDWPGWCRSGRNEDAALQALFDYGPRYSHLLQRSQLGFHAPDELDAFKVVELVKGTSTTDFGAPDVTLESDHKKVDEDDLKRWQTLLMACWRGLDQAVEKAKGHHLRKGPRGGGRELAKIVEHVRLVDLAYLRNLGGKLGDEEKESGELEAIREAILTTLKAAVDGEIPERGPRGVLRWTPRYFVRRLAWHELDHVWEIEDRAESHAENRAE